MENIQVSKFPIYVLTSSQKPMGTLCSTFKEKIKHIQKSAKFLSPANGYFATLHVTSKIKALFLYEAIIEKNTVGCNYVLRK